MTTFQEKEEKRFDDYHDLYCRTYYDVAKARFLNQDRFKLFLKSHDKRASDHLIEQLEGLKKSGACSCGVTPIKCSECGFNQAIDEAITKVKEVYE